MTRDEFSDMFTTLLNSYNTQAQFGEQASKREIVLDEYEKSVLLTQAQDLIVKSYFDRTLNNQGQGFDDSTRRQVDFSSLIKVSNLTAANDTGITRFDERGIVYKMPTVTASTEDGGDGEEHPDVLFILNEKMLDNNNKEYVVVPISYAEYDREMSKPYAQPLKKQAWRLFHNIATGFDMYSELIPKWCVTQGGGSVATYRIRYIKRPLPIILEDLPNGLTVDGYNKARDCELNPIIHIDILNKAVELAITTRGGSAPSSYDRTAQRSESR